jgi:hypothetical protein
MIDQLSPPGYWRPIKGTKGRPGRTVMAQVLIALHHLGGSSGLDRDRIYFNISQAMRHSFGSVCCSISIALLPRPLGGGHLSRSSNSASLTITGSPFDTGLIFFSSGRTNRYLFRRRHDHDSCIFILFGSRSYTPNEYVDKKKRGDQS